VSRKARNRGMGECIKIKKIKIVMKSGKEKRVD
jgi:hypothetical protein